jgi:chorismate mutase
MTSKQDDDDFASRELERCREQIAALDRELIALLRKRIDIARETGRLKRDIGLPILDPRREAAVIRTAVATARAEGLDEESVREIFWHVLGLSRRAQHPEHE